MKKKMTVSDRTRTWYESRDVHRNGKDWDPMGPMGLLREWEYDQLWE